jgi:hypothetical protein
MWKPTVARNVVHGNLSNARVIANAKLDRLYRDCYNLSAIPHRLAAAPDRDPNRDPQSVYANRDLYSLSAVVHRLAADPNRDPNGDRHSLSADRDLYSVSTSRDPQSLPPHPWRRRVPTLAPVLPEVRLFSSTQQRACPQGY